MTEFALPTLAAVLLWWVGTGAVILLDRLPRHRAGWTFAGATVFTLGAVLCISHTAQDSSVAAAYAGFTCAIVVWGWHELAFLGGWITGPRRVVQTPGAPPFKRLAEAVQVLLWHELALIGTALVLWALWGRSTNPVAALTFSLLYAMRVSAKLNLYLGVRNLALDFLPSHLVYMGSYFRKRRFNALMPVSLLAGVAATASLVAGAAQSQGGLRVSCVLLASMLVLALVEHLMLVLPLQPSALWRWALKREPAVVR